MLEVFWDDSGRKEGFAEQSCGEEMTREDIKGIPDDPKECVEMAERLADEVRALRQQLNEVSPGRTRRAERQRILLMIDVRGWKMGLLNPRKYGKKPKNSGRLDIFKNFDRV